jgi:hypothetical protein
MASKKTKIHKNQHYVPQCYTRAWLDPESKNKHNISPYVWTFSRDGTISQRKSPKNIFTETDIYTIPRESGERDLRLEHGFQELEDRFTRVRNLALSQRVWPNPAQFVDLLAFVATAQIRTKSSRDHHREQWGKIRTRMQDFQSSYEAAPSEKKRAMASISAIPPHSDKRGMSIEDVARLEKLPIQTMIAPMLSTVLTCFTRMQVAILCTDDELGFITSDSPCTWFDPQAYKLQPIYRSPALSSPTIEVTLPVSPQQCILISHHSSCNGFIDIPLEMVDRINQRHIHHCDENFIACRNAKRAVWFEKTEEPDDSWEKVRDRKNTLGEWPN